MSSTGHGKSEKHGTASGFRSTKKADDDAQAVDLIQEYEARIAALERLVGKQALELEFLKGALKNAPPPKSGTISVINGPAASPSRKDAG
ncbi:hypothetical protein J2Z31_005536 [Sinorhizobium kostiense]|uniref:Transposase n=1 Tax=Sinorhizobium kostiense TaxID=76747 RepID=A0ABS4R9K8_9HYPH|nr:hypothetical protein [Sinorhizobium kostiense]